MRRTIFVRSILYLVFFTVPYYAEASDNNSLSPKLEHNLRSLVASVHSAQGGAAQALSDTLAAYAKQAQLITVNNNVFVEFFVNDTLAVNAFLARYGIAKDNYFSRVKSRVQALVPVARLNDLADDRAVNWVQPPARPQLESVSQGVALTYADTYHNHFPSYMGAGVKVAVVDLGFYGYQNLLGTDLPSSVVAKSFRSDGDITGGGENHGTACAEVVHDMAPGAQLYLLNFYTPNDLQNTMYYCLDSGIQIISCSIGWTNESFYDGTGPIATIVDDADGSGILWCAAAGNNAQGHWDGTFSDPSGDGWEHFSGSDESIAVDLTANNPFKLDLTWNQWPLASSDYDLYLYNDANGSPSQVVASSTNVQNGFQPPVEEIIYTPSQSGLYHIKIKRNSGAAAKLALFAYETPFADYNITARSIIEPADASGAFSVGAVSVSSLNAIEPYSGEGPTEDGRMKPDISAPDCNANDVYGVFCGTSAATPHTAGAAALLLSQNSSLTDTDLKSILTKNARALGTPIPNDIFGAGFLRMPDITPPSTPAPGFSIDSAHGTSANTSVIFRWSAIDSWSGVAGYSYTADHTPGTPPPHTIATTSDSTELSLANNALWYFHIIAVDSAGNWSALSDLGPLFFRSTGVGESLDPVKFALSIYPNPASILATFSLSGTTVAPVHIQIYDMLGRAVSSLNIRAEKNGLGYAALDTRNLPAGMYVARAITPTKTLSANLFVMK